MNVLDRLETGLSTLATRLKRIGTKASFRTIASAMSLCLVAGIAAIIGGFSQDQTNGTAAKAVLPIKRTLTSKDGKSITGTITAITPASIGFKLPNGGKGSILLRDIPEKDRIMIEQATSLPVYFTYNATMGPETVEVTGRTETIIYFQKESDGMTYKIPVSKLSEDDQTWVANTPIRWPRPTGVGVETKPDGLEMTLCRKRKELTELFEADAPTLRKWIIENDPRLEDWRASFDWDNASIENNCKGSGFFFGSPLNYLKDMVIKPTMEFEKVSLRPEFEKAGIHSIKQTPDACQLYSGYSLYQFLIWKHNLQPISFEQFRDTANSFEPTWPAELLAKTPGLDRRFSKESIIRAGIALRGIRPKLVPIGGGGRLSTEVMKHFLRDGHPIWAAYRSDGAGHAVVITGFTHENGKTTFEILETQGTEYGNNGYDTINVDKLREAYVLMIE